jgi:hypothetical protein
MSDHCARAACHCDAADGEYCGAHCAETAKQSDRGPTCECGHIDCEEATMRTGGVVTVGR